MEGTLAARYGRPNVLCNMSRVADKLCGRPRHDFHLGLLTAREAKRTSSAYPVSSQVVARAGSANCRRQQRATAPGRL